MILETKANPIPKKFVSYNVNGIRAAINRGFTDWLVAVNADVIGLQEVKCLENQLDMAIFRDLGYHVYWNPAVKKGYSGVAILSKVKPDHIEYGMGLNHYDDEGRMIRADFGGISFLNTYFPSGTSGDIRQLFKYRFLDDVYRSEEHTSELQSRENLVCRLLLEKKKTLSRLSPGKQATMTKRPRLCSPRRTAGSPSRNLALE